MGWEEGEGENWPGQEGEREENWEKKKDYLYQIKKQTLAKGIFDSVHYETCSFCGGHYIHLKKGEYRAFIRREERHPEILTRQLTFPKSKITLLGIIKIDKNPEIPDKIIYWGDSKKVTKMVTSKKFSTEDNKNLKLKKFLSAITLFK